MADLRSDLLSGDTVKQTAALMTAFSLLSAGRDVAPYVSTALQLLGNPSTAVEPKRVAYDLAVTAQLSDSGGWVLMGGWGVGRAGWHARQLGGMHCMAGSSRCLWSTKTTCNLMRSAACAALVWPGLTRRPGSPGGGGPGRPAGGHPTRGPRQGAAGAARTAGAPPGDPAEGWQRAGAPGGGPLLLLPPPPRAVVGLQGCPGLPAPLLRRCGCVPPPRCCRLVPLTNHSLPTAPRTCRCCPCAAQMTRCGLPPSRPRQT